MSFPAICLNPPPEVVGQSLQVLGLSSSDEILFSVRAADARSAAEVTRVAFDQAVICVDGRRLRLEGLATIQDSQHDGLLIVRSKFAELVQ